MRVCGATFPSLIWAAYNENRPYALSRGQHTIYKGHPTYLAIALLVLVG